MRLEADISFSILKDITTFIPGAHSHALLTGLKDAAVLERKETRGMRSRCSGPCTSCCSCHPGVGNYSFPTTGSPPYD